LKPALPSARELIALTWVTGVLLFLLWVGGRAVGYTAWLRDRRRPLPPALRETIREFSAGFKFRRLPKIWLVQDISQPFVWGLLRGSVYLPADFVGLSGSDQQRSILAHELSHIARFDAGINLLQVLAQAMYWFHPFVWWSNREIRQEREKCCDEMAVAHLETQPEHYTGAIVDALSAERRSAYPIPSLAIVGSVRDIEERIRTMLTPGRKFHTRPTLVAATIALLIALVTAPTALVLTARGQVQPANQTAGQSAANNENPAQPRYAARTFNSKASFKVVVVKTADSFDPRTVGRTPSAAPLEIPTCHVWWVEPLLPVKDWALLAREINENKVPGLKLDLVTDSDMRHLADLTGLQWLNLSRTQVGDDELTDLRALNTLQFLRLDDTQVTGSGLEYLKGLTGLKTLSLMGTRITDMSLVHLKGLTGLQELWLYNTQITDAGMAFLKDLTGLRDLNLGHTRITDTGLTHLRGLTGLRELDLGGTSITDAGLEHLDLNRLTDLDVSNTQVTDAGLARLRGMTGLRRLEISGTKITDTGLEHLKGFAGLQNLGMERVSGVTDAGFAHLRGLASLQRLNLWDNRITDAGLAQLKDKDLPRLQWLSLAGTQVTDRGLAYLKVLTALQDLYLSDTQITDEGLNYLTTLTGLRGLRLNGTNITDAGLKHLKVLTGWEWLTLGGTKVTDEGLAHLKDLRRLRTLDLSGTQVTDTGLAHLKGLTGLEWLVLTGTQVTDAGVRRLKENLPNLTVVGQPQPASQDLDEPVQSTSVAAADSEKPEQPRYAARTFNAKTPFDVLAMETSESKERSIGSTPSAVPLEIPACYIWWVQPSTPIKDWDLLVREMSENKVPGLKLNGATDSDAKHLAGLTGLQWLSLQGTQITDGGLEPLTSLTGLRTLIFTDNGQGTDLGLAHLQGLTGLQALYLTGPRVTDQGLASLQALKALEELGLLDTQITDAGLARLQHLPRLKSLILARNNRITDAGMAHLEGVAGLEQLSLHYTVVTDAGLVHLRGLTRLQRLDLSGTEIDGTGLAHLKDMPRLECLYLAYTQVTDAGLANIKGLSGLHFLWIEDTKVTDLGLEHLKGLTGLQTLLLGGTQVTDAGVQQLKQSLPRLTIAR
jgi:beta-lactamase regulating signal transducer with metallopeptidase domain/Leucine-rich repeat (LRR) protein